VMLAGTAELYRRDPARLRRLETLADSSVQAIAATSAGGLVLFAAPFVETWLGPGYGDAALSVRVLAVAALLNAWSAPWTYYAIGRGRYHYVLIAAGVTLAVNAMATIILTAHIGLSGALIGSLAGSAAGTAAARLVLLRWERRNWLSPAVRATGVVGMLVVPLLLMGVRFPVSWPGLIAWAFAYVAAAGLLLLATGSLPVRLVVTGGAAPRLVWRQAEPVRRQ
jgi:O-antigen/teichoic acid export membrane protein